jgi:hypothetical protein
MEIITVTIFSAALLALSFWCMLLHFTLPDSVRGIRVRVQSSWSMWGWLVFAALTAGQALPGRAQTQSDLSSSALTQQIKDQLGIRVRNCSLPPWIGRPRKISRKSGAGSFT